jgi:hypothetical protein
MKMEQVQDRTRRAEDGLLVQMRLRLVQSEMLRFEKIRPRNALCGGIAERLS